MSDKASHWAFGTVAGAAPKISLLRTRGDAGSTCERVLSAVSDIVLDISACAPNIADHGSQIADQMASKVRQ